ncbi:MAG: hypothetical protein AB7H93_09605 [Vicinamibacterales bacterium]
MTLVGWALAGIAVRLLVSSAAADATLFADMAQYQERAQHLAATATLWPDALRGPGYPVLLAAAYRLLGDSLWSARVANAIVGGGLVFATGLLARASGAGARAWIAAAIVAVYPALVLSSVYLMPEGLYALLVVATLVMVRHRTAAFAIVAGALAAAAMLTRSVGVALGAAPLAIWARAWWRGDASAGVGASRVALFAAACAMALAPWLMFTTRVAGGPMLDATSGVNLLLGNHPGATGRLVLGDEGPLRERFVAGAASVADGNRRAVAAGVSWAAANPRAWMRLAAVKLGYLFGLEGREHAWLYGHAYFGERRAVTVQAWGVLLPVSFPLLCVAAAIGAVRAPSPPPPALVAILAMIGATAALHVVSFGESRFHLPLVPLLAVVASLGAGSGGGRGRREATPAGRPTVRIVVVSLLLAALAVGWVRQWPELRGQLERLRAADGWRSVPPY